MSVFRHAEPVTVTLSPDQSFALQLLLISALAEMHPRDDANYRQAVESSAKLLGVDPL